MIHEIGRALPLCLITLALSAGPAVSDIPDSPSGQPRVNVRLYDYAHLPDHVLSGATREAARVFRNAGVELVWLRCAPAGISNCDSSLTLLDLVVAVLPREMAVQLTKDHTVFGVTASSSRGFSTHARVFYHRAEELAERWEASRASLLGHLLAHEIGHLLLGVQDHSGGGIMRAPWSKDELRHAQHAALRFTGSQKKLMRLQVRRRLLALNPSSLARSR